MILTLLAVFAPSPASACAMYIPPEVVARRAEVAEQAKKEKAEAPAPTSLEQLMADIDAAAPQATTPPTVVKPARTTIAEAEDAS